MNFKITPACGPMTQETHDEFQKIWETLVLNGYCVLPMYFEDGSMLMRKLTEEEAALAGAITITDKERMDFLERVPLCFDGWKPENRIDRAMVDRLIYYAREQKTPKNP